MKKLLLSALLFFAASPCLFAPWAAHLVISPASKMPDPKAAEADARFTREAAELARAVSVTPISKTQVLVAIKDPSDEGPSGKGYFLVVCKKRLAADALDLRSELGGWKRTRGVRNPAVESALAASGIKRADKKVAEVRPLPVVTRGGERRVEVVLDRPHALRSYIVWDHKVIFDGAMVMDGGLWLTYDLPAFVEAAAATPAVKRR